ncbi:MAG: cobalamin B12-binding domain-containing protein, partial [Acidobacteria bacterium]|nr:cobalamin B12-binding domain-containing protein [Acidobacteriota bacterium]
EGGRAIGQVASLSNEELEELDRRASSLQRKPDKGAAMEAGPALLQPLLDAIAAYDYAATNEELGRLAVLLRPGELVHRVVLPLMRIAGDSWATGTLRIAQEHMLSACVRNLLGGLVRIPKNGKGSGRMLFTTPPGELHEFGILTAAMLAVAEDFQVAYLGPNLPAREVLMAVEKSVPHAIVLGIMKTNATPAVRDEVHRLAAELPPTTEVWLGGSGAEAMLSGAAGSRLVVLEDLIHFEQHLSRLKAVPRRESAP